VRLKAEDTRDFEFDSWDSGCVGQVRTCFVQAGSVSRVRVIFRRKISSLRITVGGPGFVRSSPPGINCGQDRTFELCDADFGRGTTVELTAQPSADGAFRGWHGPCTSGALQCAVRIGADRSATAGFARLFPSSAGNIAVKIIGVFRPRVVSVPGGIDCRNECSASFAAGTMVTLHTTLRSPNWGGAQGSWHGACYGEAPTCPLVADSSLRVAVGVVGVFKPPVVGGPDSFGVNVLVSGHGVVVGGGQINCGRRVGTTRSCQGYFGKGSTVVLRALPARGIRFVGWSGFCAGKGTCRLTVDAAKLVYAVFGR